MPQSIVVYIDRVPVALKVGGSMAGLMHGLQLKREGNDVTILEREPISERSSHEAGVGFRTSVEEFLRRFDETGLTSAFTSDDLQFAYRRRANIFASKMKYKLTSWGLLYRILRANFDGFASTACPQPPPSRKEDGNATYLAGRQVTDIQYADGIVTVHYSDVTSGKAGSVTADLVIGADGVHSIVRELVKAPMVKQYAGYVAWRGTVPEKFLSKATLDYFTNGLSFNLMRRTYIVCYVIPTDAGVFEPGERLVNWVWYYNVAEDSPEIAEILTGTDGKLRKNTVSSGLVNPQVWDRVRAAVDPRMAAPFAELLGKTDQPFVTKVNDAICSAPRHCDGRVVLVGDALTTIRPHTALATEQAARHCLLLGKARKGEISMEDWDHEVCVYARRMLLLSRLVGELGQGSTWMFLKSVYRYLMFMIRLKLGG
ncbi:hypothetical protein DL770_000699 [Monosporascus sp. CRB-9-2]|nr:hypothetical protein DL770_000699 [Monosporascus sp. CRB-9-2]